MISGATGSRVPRCLLGALLATSLAVGCGTRSGPLPDGGGGSSGADGYAGRAGGGAAGAAGRAGTTGTAGASGGGTAGDAGRGGTAGAASAAGGASGGSGAPSGAGGDSAGTGGRGGATGYLAGCIEGIWSVAVQLTDGTLLDLVYSTGALTTVLDDATGKPLTGVIGVEDNAATGADCAALTDGTVKCWLVRTDKAGVGQLGNGTTAVTPTLLRATPVVTTGGVPLANVRAMAEGDFGEGSCALTNDNTVYCWGDLSWIAGDGATALPTGSARLLTIDGANPLTGVIQVAVAYRQACVLRHGASGGASPNEIWCWGYAAMGELGQGNTTNLPHPTKVPGLTNPSAIVMTAAYILNTVPLFADAALCALDGGKVLCWGATAEGAIGNGATSTTSGVSSPTAVVGKDGAMLDGVVDISAGYGSFSALRSDGSLWVWGHGQLPYARSYATGVVAIGYGTDSGGFGPTYLTSDGVYHNATRAVSITCPSR